MRFSIILFILTWFTSASYGQQPVKISIVLDGGFGTEAFLNVVQNEINVLLTQQYDITYNDIIISDNNLLPDEAVRSAMEDDSDLLITLGFNASRALSSLNEYPKPSIAGISLQSMDRDTTGIDNYTLIQSPFSIERDFSVFQSIYPFKQLAVFVQQNQLEGLEPYFNSFADGFDIQYFPVSDDPLEDLNKLNDDVDAVYFVTNLYRTEDDYRSLINGINERKLPSFSLIGRNDVELGILASISPSDYIEIYTRRIALNVMKILEGQNPKSFPINIEGVENDFVINVATMESLEIYPPFEVLSQASLINLERNVGKKYNLRSAIVEAINNNLAYQSAQKNVDVQDTEIGIAKSNLLPNVNANTNVVTLDNATADFLRAGNQLTPQTEWTGNIEIQQLIYSQPAWANLAIQKALLNAEKAGLMAQQLDLVLDVSTVYLQVLQAQANLNIQNTNVQTTLSNLNIAKTKVKIGTLSNADVYGFESELALNKSSLNNANTTLEQARISFNQLLNRPLNEKFVLDDITLDTTIIFLQDERLSGEINNQYDFRKFAEFLIETALINSPEIEQLQWAIKAQEESLNANKKSFYLPQIALQGSLDKTFGRYGTRTSDDDLRAIGVDPYKPTWNVGVNATIPIFQGNLRNKRVQQDRILVEQLKIDRAALEQQFAANIRLSLENLGNSYNDIQFTQQAERSSMQFLEIVQDLYREGVSNIVTLLEAQNNTVSASLGAVSSRYQFIIDALTIERLFNKVYLLLSPQERESFINDYFNFLTKKD